MLKDITLGQYIPGNSFLHRLDPRVKIMGSFVMIVVLFIVNNLVGYAFVALVTSLMIASSHVPFKMIYRGIKPLIYILFFTLILHTFMNPGRLIFSLGPLTATWEGLQKGFYMSLRLLLLIIATSLLTYTTSPIELTDGVERLLRPFQRFGVPAHELAMMMTIALRFIPTLLEEAEKIMKAQKARGADFESGNILQRAKSLIPLMVPLFVSSFRRADELAIAMEARCYRGGKNRTRMKQLSIGKDDYVAMVELSLIIFISVGTRYLKMF